MRICLIGSNGLLASAIGRLVSQLQEELIVIGRSHPNKFYCNKFISLNLLTDIIPISECLESDVVIYAAAAGVQSNAQSDSKDIYMLNAYIPLLLAEQLRVKNYKGLFISFGSYFEIGCNIQDRHYNEEEVIGAQMPVVNTYCVSKRLLTRYFDSCLSGLRFLHLILPTIYGPQESKQRLIPYLINSIKTGSSICLTDGSQVRQYLFVDDFVKLLYQMISKKEIHGIYNIPCAETLTVKEVASVIHTYFEKPMESDVFGLAERADQQMKILKLSSEKLISIFNVPTFQSISTIIPYYLS